MGTRRLAAFAVALVAAGLLVACSGGTPSAGGSPAVTVSVTPEADRQSTGQPSPAPPAPSVTPPAGAVATASAPDRPAPSQLEQTITGQVEAGVERGCLILRDPTGTYQLLGGDPTIVYAGANVSLTGHVVTGVMSYCMQGKPFQITHASRR
jgi:hypothetical protein